MPARTLEQILDELKGLIEGDYDKKSEDIEKVREMINMSVISDRELFTSVTNSIGVIEEPIGYDYNYKLEFIKKSLSEIRDILIEKRIGIMRVENLPIWARRDSNSRSPPCEGDVITS